MADIGSEMVQMVIISSEMVQIGSKMVQISSKMTEIDLFQSYWSSKIARFVSNLSNILVLYG